MVFANKYLVGDHLSRTDVSLFVAWVQCIECVGYIFFWYIGKMAVTGDRSALTSPCLRIKNVCHPRILMMTCSYVSMLTFNNLCLKHVGVAFYQVARSLTLIFTVVLSVIILKKPVSIRVIACCITVAFGFILGTDQESLAGTLSVEGVLYGVISSMFIALNGIFTKRALDVVDHDSVKLTLFNNINACVVFIPFVLLTGQLQNVVTDAVLLTDYVFWTFLVASGLLGFLIAWISAVQLDITSPVTHHISSNSKSVLQTIIAVAYYQDQKSLLWWCGILLVVIGAFAYAMVRIKESELERPETNEEDEEELL